MRIGRQSIAIPSFKTTSITFLLRYVVMSIFNFFIHIENIQSRLKKNSCLPSAGIKGGVPPPPSYLNTSWRYSNVSLE